MTGIFTAITAILSPISIYLPFTPVPVSFGLLAVFITGVALPARLALFSQMIFLLIGCVGIPIFSGFRGGLSVLLGPTGGYLFAYPFMVVFISSMLAYYGKVNKIKKAPKFVFSAWSFLVLLSSLLICYGMGTPWLSFVLKISFAEALAMAVYPFVAVDVIKIIFCIIVILPYFANGLMSVSQTENNS